MLKTIGFCLKLTVFSFLVLILGNWLRWNGRTISDQVKLRMAHAERTDLYETVRGWATTVTSDAKKGVQKRLERASGPQAQEEISSSERQKLKALIRELNSSRKKD